MFPERVLGTVRLLILRSNDRGSLQRVERFICVLFAKDAGNGNRRREPFGRSTWQLHSRAQIWSENEDNLEGAHPSCMYNYYILSKV